MVPMLNIYFYILFLLVCSMVPAACAFGHLLLYRPRDITNECVFSQRLRFDLSFGMGMSDTITLVFRTLNEIDYACAVEIAASSESVYLIIVIRFPGHVGSNCAINRDAFTLMKKDKKCLRICDLLKDRNNRSSYFVLPVKGSFDFRFLSNSSINTYINANLYEVTATTARMKPKTGCKINETACTFKDFNYCFTNFVVCDGIKNCGVPYWFDESKYGCVMDVEILGYASIVAVIAALLCAILIATHLLLRCLPPLTSSFYIFNVNEDNRLRINPVFKSPDLRNVECEATKRSSIIPVFSSSSSSDAMSDNCSIYEQHSLNVVENIAEISNLQQPESTKTKVKSVKAKLHKKFRSVSRFGREIYKKNTNENRKTSESQRNST